MMNVASINVVGVPVELTSIEDPVFSYQNPVPIGFETEAFQFNTALYASDLFIEFLLKSIWCRGLSFRRLTSINIWKNLYMLAIYIVMAKYGNEGRREYEYAQNKKSKKVG
jgi:hypothetical protein